MSKEALLFALLACLVILIPVMFTPSFIIRWMEKKGWIEYEYCPLSGRVWKFKWQK